MTALIIILALCAGFGIGYTIAALKTASLHRENTVLNTRLEETCLKIKESSERAANDIARVTQEKDRQMSILLAEKESSFGKLLSDRDKTYRESIDECNRTHQESLETLRQRFDETVSKLKAELELQSSNMLKQRQIEFENSSRKTLEGITAPLNISLQEMKKAVAANTEKHTELGGQLSENIKQVIVQTDATRRSADHLANVLRAGAKIQGNLGEVILSELLQSQGLKEGVHFDTQCTLQDVDGRPIISDSGHRLQPDLVFHIDGERDLVVDAKVSLTAFLDYANSDSEEARAVLLQKHIESIESHVKGLASKGYADYRAQGKTPAGFVIMFVPYSAALRLAMDAKPSLWRKAMECNVYIADEETLFAAIKIIALTWRQMDQAKNHERVYELANEMVDRVQAFLISFSEIQSGLRTANDAYESALKKLQDTGQSIPGTCKKLIKLGARLNNKRKKTPAILLNDSEEDNPESSNPAFAPASEKSLPNQSKDSARP